MNHNNQIKDKNKTILSKINEISSLLHLPGKKEIGLYIGNAGIALFLFYYARLKNVPDVHRKATEMVDDLFTQIETTPQLGFSLCSGIAGVGWLVDHLCKQGFLMANPDEVLSDIDEYLYHAALNELYQGHYDFMHGAMGIVLYLVKRNRQGYLCHLVDELSRIAIWDGDGAKWESIIKHEDGIRGYNIALSHGSSSLALVLCKILQITPENETAKRLLKGAVEYICNQEISVEKHGCYFPAFSIESQPIMAKTRLAWCYGDLGIALAIWQSGLLLGNQGWIEKVMEVLLFSAHRRGLPDNMVRDAGICHGTAGIAHVFNRLHRNTKRVEFKDAAGYWCNETLKMATFEDGLAGYKAWYTPEHDGWQPTDSLLEGIAGIGLCLLSFVMQEDPAWDECLLLNVSSM